MSRDVCAPCDRDRATLYVDIESEARVCAHRIPAEVTC